MAKRGKVAGNPELDPTLPKIPLILDGKEFYLCFTFAAMAHAQAKLRAAGIAVNLLRALYVDMDAETIVALLYAAMLTHQPDITPVEVEKLISIPELGRIYDAVGDAYSACIPKADKDAKENPSQPQP
jgi:hypothetical protein